MLCLSHDDILKAMTPAQILGAVREAMILHETDQYLMPERLHMDFSGNTLLAMPCMARGKFGTKLVSVFPQNPSHHLPVVIGTMLLNDGETGNPLALLNGTTLTALRTGAIGATALDHLAPPSLNTIGIVGTGVQGFYQALFASHARPLSRVYLFDKDPQKAIATAASWAQLLPGCTCLPTHSIEELLQLCPAIFTTTTSPLPVLPENPSLLKGKLVVAIGSFRPTKRELPDALFPLLKNVYVDTLHALHESGDLVIPIQKGLLKPQQVLTLGSKLTTPPQPPNQNEAGETLMFKSVGMALFDLLTASLLYDNALKQGLGQEILL